MARPKRIPTAEEAKIVNAPKPEDLAETKTETHEAITYDTSKPVFMVSKKKAGRIKIPLYEEVPQVQGYFRNLEHPGQSLTIPHRAWKGPIRYFTLIEDKLTSIPITLCELLNNGACYVEKRWVTPDGRETTTRIIDLAGNRVAPNICKEIARRKPRFQFQVLNNVNWKPKIEQEFKAAGQ